MDSNQYARPVKLIDSPYSKIYLEILVYVKFYHLFIINCPCLYAPFTLIIQYAYLIVQLYCFYLVESEVGAMKKEGLLRAFVSMVIICIVIISFISFIIYNTRLIGPIIIVLGLIPWIPLKLSGRTIKSVGADILFGAIDTGLLGIAALIGASLAGTLGAIVGGAVGDSITDGFAGLGEGKIAEYLRRHGIEEARTPLSSSMGKTSGCLLGVGIVLTITWGILGIATP